MEEEYKETLVVFDADFLLFYATMGNKIYDAEGVPMKKDGRLVYTEKSFKEVCDTADSIINSLLKVVNAQRYIGFIGNAKCFRYDIYPEYKANRKDTPKPQHFKELKAYLRDTWNFILLDIPIEADDAVNIIKTRLEDQYRVYIVSNDKDLIKCTPGYFINPKDCEIFHTSIEEARHNFWVSMITGDTTDNIKGIPKCGVAYARRIFKDLNYDEKSTKRRTHFDAVFQAYEENFGKEFGVLEFNKNYKLLHILTEDDRLPTPELSYVLVEAKKKEDSEYREEISETGSSTKSTTEDNELFW